MIYGDQLAVWKQLVDTDKQIEPGAAYLLCWSKSKDDCFSDEYALANMDEDSGEWVDWRTDQPLPITRDCIVFFKKFDPPL